MVSTDLRGKTQAAARLHHLLRSRAIGYTYGLGMVISGELVAAEPVVRPGRRRWRPTCPAQKIAIAVAVTYAPEAFDDQGDYANEAEALFRRIGAELAPDDAPPMPAPR